MKLSILTVVDHYPDRPRDLGKFYRELIDQAVLADRLGYESFFVAEHHFHPYGVVPNPAVILGAIAERTTRIRLGPAVTILPFRDPRTVAEDYAMLDLLSGGRLVLGLGSGYLKHEFAGFARDPAEKRERFDEAMVLIKQLIGGERVTHRGKYNTLEDVALNIRAVQPRVPIYVAALAREAAYYIGRQGNGLFTIPYGTLERISELGPLVAAFAKGRAESGAPPMPQGLAPHMATFHTHVAPSEAEAEAGVRGPFELYCRTRLYAKPWSYEQIRENGLALFGSVESVAEKLRALAAMGVESVAAMMNFGAMAPEKVEASMRLLIEAALPRLAR